jgi:hypothetical protein
MIAEDVSLVLGLELVSCFVLAAVRKQATGVEFK